MDYGKYIIVEQLGHEVAIMFDSISHADFISLYPNKEFIVSAGFFLVGAKARDDDPQNIGIAVFGKSETLKLEVRKDKDERLIKRVLRK